MGETAFTRALLEKHNQVLTITLVVSVLANLLLGIGLIAALNAPPLIVRKEFNEMVKLRAEKYEVNEEHLKDFVNMVSEKYLSFSPTSLPEQVEEISVYLENTPKKALLDSYERNREKIITERIFHQFVIKNIEITKKNHPYWVEVEGLRAIVSTTKNSTVEKTYVFEVRKVKPTVENLYGLVVSQVVEKEEEGSKEEEK
ncbi:MAG: hypothetical protein KKH94_02335 [Candidatus Omnitrophica bacterium]|nr:hypothetical protein [Candidatus Omnitrophota bacterium]